ncbi:MAG: chemotaxis protein CheB, partial [Spirochaetia bacterium]|nr:chemotaxis protein CheB [Spirochaetia bacterium]
GIVVVQHMPPGFTKMFSERLNQICAMAVKEAEDGDRVLTGRILIAPGGLQTRVKRRGGFYYVECTEADKVSGHAPSVDVLMHSVAEEVGANALGAILTGMGADGADGMLAMRKKGARTVAQDEESSVVFGMPKQAFERGGAEILCPLTDISGKLLEYLKTQKELTHALDT